MTNNTLPFLPVFPYSYKGGAVVSIFKVFVTDQNFTSVMVHDPEGVHIVGLSWARGC